MGDGPVTESCIYRKNPKFKRFEILRWDELPVPVSIEVYRKASHRGAADNLDVHRERQDLSSWVLVGDGNRRRFELGAGWDCSLETSLANGFRSWTRQRVVGETILRTWTTIDAPGTDRTLAYTGSFGVTPWRVNGGSIQMGQLQILRFKKGLSISLENREIGIRRDWRLDQSSQRKVRICDLQDPDASQPCIIASSDNSVSLRKTIRWLVLELTGLIVADEFLSWNVPNGIEIEQPVTYPVPVVAVMG